MRRQRILLRYHQIAAGKQSADLHLSKRSTTIVFTPQAIGFVRSPYTDSKAIPKGLGAKHDAEGVLEILPEFEPGSH